MGGQRSRSSKRLIKRCNSNNDSEVYESTKGKVLTNSTKKLSATEWLKFFSKYKATWSGACFDCIPHIIIYTIVHYALWMNRADIIVSAILVILIALLDIKTATISHDCGHNSYTPNHAFNYFFGIISAVFIFFPYSWNYRHNTHHMTNGNQANKYGFNFNELIQYKLSDYEGMSPKKRLFTSIVFHPFNLFAILVPLNCFIFERFSSIPLILNRNGYHTLPSTFWLIFEQILGNIGVAAMIYVSWQNELLLHILLAKYIFFILSGLLFVNQHTYNPPYVVKDEAWNLRDSGLRGSSFLLIPWCLKYFTGSIEYHHIHHMNTKAPGYNLQAFHEEVLTVSTNEFDDVVQLNMSQCWNNLSYSLYDDQDDLYISFKTANSILKKSKSEKK